LETDLFGFAYFKPSKKTHRDIHYLVDIPQTGRADPVHSSFIFLNLLEFDTYFFCQLLLVHSDQPPPLTIALTRIHINRIIHFRLQ